MTEKKIIFLGSTYNEHSRWGLFDKSGLSPTLTAAMGLGGGYVPMILEDNNMDKVHVIGQMDNTIDHTFESANRIYDIEGISPTLPTCCGGGHQPKILEYGEEKMNEELKIKRIGQISSEGSQYGTILSEEGLSATLGAGCHGYANNCIQQKYKIRKLTPKECFRLMNFDDKDFYAAESVNSNTRLYSQAGNSIVVGCLVAIFSQLNIKGVTPWNEMTLEQKYELTKVNICENPGYEQEPI